ncbi:tyrosine-type recombinase/integrase [Roseococcus microcysteis]|uniref:tyrosine-type recombinase/integrase n=1 Tax=Roseococcus microcysteis TaxID=2771361 RepID=UPI00168B5B4C|nr:tyrosine-type recombinase/integrase [Roseococcus microcysteis]
MPSSRPAPAPPELRHLKRVRRGDRVWLYYRRGRQQWALPGPEGSAAFLLAYERVHAAYGTLQAAAPRQQPGTVDAAITLYLASADFLQLAPKTQADYRRVLDGFRGAFGALPLMALDAGWWEALRAKHVAAPDAWNRLRARMKDVVALYRRMNPHLVTANPLAEVKRLKTGRSDQNRAWPLDVLAKVMAAATPEFRALLTGYLLTAQRGGDVTGWRRSAYREAERQLHLVQGKTDVERVLHVPEALAEAFRLTEGRADGRLFATPRGRPWTVLNAQETLRRLLEQLGLPRYTLHGLRATGPTAAKLRGLDNRMLRELTGHTSDSNLEIYLRGAGGYTSARAVQETLEEVFGATIEAAEAAGNTRRYAGVTGRAAAKKVRSEVETALATGNSDHGRDRRKVAKV